jgi:uroporphyrinogen-III synthase
MTEVLVTRPAPEAQRWVQACHAAGWLAHALPLIETHPAADTAAVQASQAHAGTCDALMFVSPQAVRCFADPVWIDSPVRCWAPGPGTAQALQAAGVSASRIDCPAEAAAQFDSEALWAQVSAQVGPGHRLLVVRGQSADGATGRPWLLRQCEAQGGTVQVCTAYHRAPPNWSPETRAWAQDRLHNGAIWLLSSSEALAHLQALIPHASYRHARALVTHPRIEATARQMGFGHLRVTRPTLPEVLLGLQAFL